MSGSKVRAVAVGPASCGLCSANLTPGHRHCRQSPADATEGNEPKTDRKNSNRRARRPGLAMRLPVRPWRRAVGQLVENMPGCGIQHRTGCARSSLPPTADIPQRAPCYPPASALVARQARARICTRTRQPRMRTLGLLRRHALDRRPNSPSRRYRTTSFVLLRSVFGSFPSVASAGLRLQCRWPGVKFALSKPQLAGSTAAARTLLPDTGAVPLGADDATVGNGPQPPQEPPAQGPEATTLWNCASSPREPRAPAGGAGPSPGLLTLIVTLLLILLLISLGLLILI